MRPTGALALLALSVAVLSVDRVAAFAAGEESRTEIVVQVVGAAGEAVVARVLIVGTSTGQSYQRVTDHQGRMQLSVQPGRYWVTAEARGFQSARRELDLVEGETAQLVFSLEGLQLIGHVRSRSDISRVTSDPSSVARRISPTLSEALSSVAGVAAASPDGGLGIRVSLQGADESLTQYGLGGAPLPANAAALAINTDLVQSVQVDQSRELVQFAGLSPTATPNYRLRARAGSYGAAFESVSFQDTISQTGIAVVHTVRAAESPLNGAVYEDSSGESYRHVGALHTTGDYAKILGPLGSFAGSASMAISRNAASPLQTYFAGRLPAGTGPGETAVISTRNSVLTLNGAIGSNSIALTYADFVVDSRDRQPNRSVDGFLFPYDLRLRTYVNTFSVGVERGFAGTLTADGSVQVFNQRTTSVLGDVRSAAAARTYQAELRLSRSARESEGWSAEYKHGRVGGLDYDSIEARLARHLTDRVAAVGTAFLGTIGQEGNETRLARGWIDPYAANFDCSGATIVTEGPGDAGAVPRKLRLFGTLSSQFGVVHASASAWYTHLQGEMLSTALVPLHENDPALPPGYVSSLLAEAASPLRCGAGQGPYAVFARRDVAGANVTDRGLSASLSADHGKLHSELTLDLTSAKLDFVNAALRDPKSMYEPGRQLIGVPQFRSTLLLDRILGPGSEALVWVHFESSNNSYNLPPFFTAAAGISRRFSPTSAFTLVAGNIFNAYAGTFVSPRYAVPVRTADGTLLRSVAAPLQPFRVSAQYDLALGH